MNVAVQNLVLSFTIKMLLSDTCTSNCHMHWGFRRRGEMVVWRGNNVRTNSTAARIDCGVTCSGYNFHSLASPTCS